MRNRLGQALGSVQYRRGFDGRFLVGDIATHMKTTIDIADALLNEARKVARREKTTLKNLVEEGLRKVLERRRSGEPFRLRQASFRGRGLQPEFRDASWQRIRGEIYEGRGG